MPGRWATRGRALCWTTSTLDLATGRWREAGLGGASGRMTAKEKTAESVPDGAKLNRLKPEGEMQCWTCQWEGTLEPGAAYLTLHNPNLGGSSEKGAARILPGSFLHLDLMNSSWKVTFAFLCL